jgi:hypothetical protein
MCSFICAVKTVIKSRLGVTVVRRDRLTDSPILKASVNTPYNYPEPRVTPVPRHSAAG